ncbi:MAG: hypothetical protein JWQ75_3205 [Pseudarthrobacter sp.]|nr:hypothetical protein [Pseudarthrobacter sp.]
MTAEEFLAGYSERSGIPLEELLATGRVVATCRCGDEMCDEWQLTRPENLLHWREEEIVIPRFDAPEPGATLDCAQPQ